MSKDSSKIKPKARKKRARIRENGKELASQRFIFRQMAQMYQAGMDAKAISAYMGVNQKDVEHAISTEVFKNHVAKMRAASQYSTVQFHERFERLTNKALDRLEEFLSDDGLPADIHLRVIEIVGDRHPEGLLAKQSKQQVTHNVGISYDSKVIEELKRNARSIDVEAQPVEEPNNGESNNDLRVETGENFGSDAGRQQCLDIPGSAETDRQGSGEDGVHHG